MSQARALLLAEAAGVTGLGEGLPAGLARWRAPRVVHDPGGPVPLAGRSAGKSSARSVPTPARSATAGPLPKTGR